MKTMSLSVAAQLIPCTERWLADGLRSGRFKGRKIMGSWRLTDADVDAIIDACAAEAPDGSLNRPAPSSRSQAIHRSKRRAS